NNYNANENMQATKEDSIALGTKARATSVKGIAIGSEASVTQEGGVALGEGAVAETALGQNGYYRSH
ncbi:hypothetical protein Q7535_13130, partial [Glaesserella parasuis]|nr:hypothetical protein [Glaesserella parasuis]